MTTVAAFLALTLLLDLAEAQPPTAAGEQAVPLEGVIAVINNEPVTRRDVELMVRSMLKEDPAREPKTAAEQGRLMQDAMTRVVVEKLLEQVARREDFQIGETVEERVRLEREKAGSEANFQKLLSEQNMTLEELESSFESQARTRRFVDTYFFGDRATGDKRPSVDVNASPSELLDYYRQHREKFTVRAASHVRQIYLSNSRHGGPANVATIIERLQTRVTAGEDFVKLAAEWDDLGSRKDGDLGWIDLETGDSDYPDDVMEFARKKQKGDLSAPIRNEFGTYINWIEEKRGARRIPFREVQAEIRKQVLDDKYNTYQYRMLKRLVDRAVIHPPELARAMRGDDAPRPPNR